jgi:hypothetical protein
MVEFLRKQVDVVDIDFGSVEILILDLIFFDFLFIELFFQLPRTSHGVFLLFAVLANFLQIFIPSQFRLWLVGKILLLCVLLLLIGCEEEAWFCLRAESQHFLKSVLYHK